jgi:hypothetical protein
VRFEHRSPCCRADVVQIETGRNARSHYRCDQCKHLYVREAHGFAPCESEEDHARLSELRPEPQPRFSLNHWRRRAKRSPVGRTRRGKRKGDGRVAVALRAGIPALPHPKLTRRKAK